MFCRQMIEGKEWPLFVAGGNKAFMCVKHDWKQKHYHSYECCEIVDGSAEYKVRGTSSSASQIGIIRFVWEPVSSVWYLQRCLTWGGGCCSGFNICTCCSCYAMWAATSSCFSQVGLQYNGSAHQVTKLCCKLPTSHVQILRNEKA